VEENQVCKINDTADVDTAITKYIKRCGLALRKNMLLLISHRYRRKLKR